MKLSIAKNELQRGLTRIQSIVEKRNTMPILANVLLEASKTGSGTLALAATDLEVGIRSSHPAEVKKAGSVTAAAKKLYEIVRERYGLHALHERRDLPQVGDRGGHVCG